MMQKWNIIFMGTPAFSVLTLDLLIRSEHIISIYTQPDRPKGRGQDFKSTPIKEIADHYKIPCFQPETLSETVVSEIKKQKPDLIVVSAYGLFLPKTLLDIPKYRCINIHPSLLPKYRGAAPIQWALINGDKETGTSIIYVAPKMDAGDILLQKKIRIQDEDTFLTIEKKLSKLSATLLLDAIKGLKKNELLPVKQKDSEVVLAPKLTKEMGNIQWDQSAQQIYNLIRGVNPWPGTYTFHQNDLLKIHIAKLKDKTFKNLLPGKINSVTDEEIIVETGQGLLSLTEIQKPNKKRMSVKEFLKGNRITPGSFFHS